VEKLLTKIQNPGIEDFVKNVYEEDNTMEFTIYWLDGKREVLVGTTISDAVRNGGYGGGAVKAIDVYVDGNDNSYVWDKELHKWVRNIGVDEQYDVFGDPEFIADIDRDNHTI
jgi:hypothetical protein